jgi:hypothetical protein
MKQGADLKSVEAGDRFESCSLSSTKYKNAQMRVLTREYSDQARNIKMLR